MSQWRIRVDGHEHGPFDHATAKVYARENPFGEAWWPGLPDWTPIAQIPELGRKYQGTPTPPTSPYPGPGMAAASGGSSPTPPAAPTQSAPRPATPAAPTQQAHQEVSSGYGASGVTEGIDYFVYGKEMQFVEIELDPGEAAVAEAGGMMYKDATVEMETIFGDGSEPKDTGIFGRLLGAGQRLITGESLFTTVFTQKGQGKGRVAFAAPYPGNILALNLEQLGGKLVCQKDSFLAAAKGVSIGIHFQKKILTGLFGGEGFIMQKLEGNGWVFVHMGGTLVEKELAPGEVLHVDTGCVAAFMPTVDFDVQRAGGIKTMFFGGEGVFFARLEGPGKIWLQSLPFSRLASRMLAAAPASQGGGGQDRGEGSILGGFGDLLDGDNRF